MFYGVKACKKVQDNSGGVAKRTADLVNTNKQKGI